MFPISAPFAAFVDRNGNPLQDGFIYFGLVNQNPKTAPTTVYWDKAGTKPAAQPIRTVNGYPVRNGAPSQIYIAGDHSISVYDRHNQLVITEMSATDAFGAGSVQTVNLADGAVTTPKLDPNGVDLADGSTAETQTGSDDSALIATTAQVQAAIQLALTSFLTTKVYPIGSIYTSTTSTDNPNTILGFGSWTAIAGRVLVGYDNAQTEFDALLETGGAKTHTLTESEIPAHSHNVSSADPAPNFNYGVFDSTNKYVGVSIGGSSSENYALGGINTAPTLGLSSSTGGGQGHNNLQPYIVAAMWRRTA